MEIPVILILLAAAAFLLGAFVVFTMLVRHILHSQSVIVERARVEAFGWGEALKNRTEEFEAITKKASDANMSLGQSIIDFDLKLKDLENRVAMVRMQR